MATAHPGFKSVQKKIAAKYGMQKAGAILAASSRNASASAKAKNPKLNKVNRANGSSGSRKSGGSVSKDGTIKARSR